MGQKKTAGMSGSLKNRIKSASYSVLKNSQAFKVFS